MDSQEIKRQSADNKTETAPYSSEHTSTASGRFSALLPTDIQNLTKRTSADLSGRNVSKSGRFQLQSLPKNVSENKPNRPSPNLPLVSNESKISVPVTASFFGESDSSSQVLRSTGPLQIQRRGNRLDVGIRLGKDYRLQRHLGNGQCGETWLAEEVGTNNFVVLKPIPQSIQNNEDAVNSVLKSYRRVSTLRFRQQPGICPVFQLALDEILGYFMVSAFADALPLNEYYERYCRSFDDFPISLAVQLLQPIASALDFAHAKKITHRMLKPQNILIGKHCGVVVTDFEITEVVRRELSRSNTHFDTVSAAHWQAPEVWLDQQYTPRSDQFSLGVLACQLITGEQPFYGEDEEELRQSILSDEPIIEESLSEQIRLTLRKSLAKKPEDRFPSCSDFVTELTKSPEFNSDIQTPPPDIWSFKDIETTLDPQDASRQANSTFPYTNKPKGYSGSSFGLTRLLIILITVIFFAAVLGTATVWGTIGFSIAHKKIEAEKSQKPSPTEIETKTDSKQNQAKSTSEIGSSVWGQHVEPIAAKDLAQYIRLAAEGDVTAQCRLGEVYFYGKGIKPDYFKAVEYFRLAADQENVSAIYHIGRCCELGLGGLKHDTTLAIEIYQKAAQKGSASAVAALKRLKVKGY